MKKTFVTTMPDHVGAFVKASRVMADLELNLTRVSYNKAIDLHTIFIEAEGPEDKLELATARLREIGYLQGQETPGQVVLVECRLPDVPGSVSDTVELVERYGFNISYISSQSNHEGIHLCILGLFVKDSEKLAHFLNAVSRRCPVRVVDYDRTEKILDNSVFYVSFASELANRMGLDTDGRNELVVNSNLVMHAMEDRGKAFHKTFDAIRGFCEVLARHRGDNFQPRITEHDFGDDLHIIHIDPPCGSNTCILCHKGMYLFVDTGYACYRPEMLRLLRELIPDFDTCRKAAVLTHADVDHCGLLDLFDTIYMTRRSRESLLADSRIGDFRERNPISAPFIRICKTLSGYTSPRQETIRVIGRDIPELDALLTDTGTWQFGDLNFTIYEGQGGHLAGEMVLVERERRLVFPGDIFINLKELSPQQAECNSFAPYLMASVDTDPTLSAAERRALPQILGSGQWTYFTGHGPRMDITID